MSFPAKEIIESDAAEAVLANLRSRKTKIAQSIEKRVDVWKARLLHDVQCGELVPLPLPVSAKALETRHGPIDKLRCCDLPDGWRLLYSFYHVDRERYVYILEIVDHATCSRWFQGRRKFGRTRA